MNIDSTTSPISYERPLSSEGTLNEAGGDVRPIWTSLMEEMLIHYIRANRLLWDPKHPQFTKPTLKRRKVEDIAAIIKREARISEDLILNPEDVWKKFRNLRTVFVREVRRVNERRHEANEDPYVSKWVHFNRMLFLVDSLKKRIQANVPLPGVATNPVSVKLEGGRTRMSVSSLSTLTSIQQQHQESEDELRIGGEWVGRRETDSPPLYNSNSSVAGPSVTASTDKNCDRVISRSSSRAASLGPKRTKTMQSQDKKLMEVSEAFGNFVTASVRRLPEDKQHALMAKITQAISEFHRK